MTYIQPWLKMILDSFLPFVILLVCNAIMCKSLILAASKTLVINACTSAVSNTSSGKSENQRMETAKRTTITILTISTTFILLTLPLVVSVIWHNWRVSVINFSPRQYAMSVFLQTLFGQLRITNSAINFYLYCLTGTRFRQEFWRWISCGFSCCFPKNTKKSNFLSPQTEKTL